MNLKKCGINARQVPAIAVGLTLFFASLSLYFFMKNNERHRISHAITQQAQVTKMAVLDAIKTRAQALERLSERWEKRGGIPEKEWAHQAEHYGEYMPGTVLLEWANKDDTLHWSIPLKNHDSHALSLKAHYEKQRKKILNQARVKKTMTMTPMLEFTEGDKYFLFCVPLFSNKQLDGFILATYHTQDFFSDILQKELYQHYTIKLLENNVPFYVQKAAGPPSHLPFSKSHALTIYSHTWHLYLKPNMAAFQDINLHPKLPFIAFLIAAMLALLIGAILFFASILHHRNKDLRKKNQAFQDLTHFDYLTGLYNRKHFDDNLNINIARCKRTKLHFALLHINLNGFKSINDAHGHDVGDEILIQVGKRLKSILREYDSIARIGGDEFTVILNDANNREQIGAAAERIITAISAPYHTSVNDITVGINIGIACFPRDGEQAKELKKIADVALYKAKSQGKNQFQFWEV